MVLKIYDDIVNSQEQEWRVMFGGSEGVSFATIDDFVNSLPDDDDTIDLLIHCRGGVVSEGWAIVDKLRATGKKISATVDGLCASMAVAVLLAASERRAQPHATLHIHKPMFNGCCFSDGAFNEDDLKRMAADLEIETGRMLDWYVERTGADRLMLENIMKEDRDMTMEEAISLGFIHSIVPPMSACTANKQKLNLSNDMAKTSKEQVLTALANFLGVKMNIEEVKVNFSLMTADGQELTINKPDGEKIAVGDSASPDGEFVLEDGRTVVIADGVVTEIREAEPEPDPEPAPEPEDDEKKNLIAENEALKAKVAEMEASIKNEEEKSILDKVQKAGGMEWLNEVAKSNYVPAQRQTQSPVAQKVDKTAERLAAMKAKNNK